jgi:hypothetical protein
VNRQAAHPRCAVDNNLVRTRKTTIRLAAINARAAHGIIASATMSQHMKNNHPLTSVSISNSSEKVASLKTRLTDEQFEHLSRCAKGISLRFERLEIVDALVAGGYAEKGVAGVVTVTIKGQQYLRAHAS